MKFIFPGIPFATKRVRCGCIQGHGHAYNDPQQTRDMRDVKALVLEQWEKRYQYPNDMQCRDILEAKAYGVTLQFFMPIAKSETITERNLKLWGLIKCTDKPDFDNLAKFYCDCATGIVWPDDKQIICGISHKVRFSLNPRTEMTVRPIEEIKLNDCQNAVFKTFSPLEMKEMLLQAIQLGNLYGIYHPYLEDTDNIPYESFLAETSLHVATFAYHFADKLKKVAKQSGYTP